MRHRSLPPSELDAEFSRFATKTQIAPLAALREGSLRVRNPLPHIRRHRIAISSYTPLSLAKMEISHPGRRIHRRLTQQLLSKLLAKPHAV